MLIYLTRRFAIVAVALLAINACGDSGWEGEWRVVEVSTPLTGANKNPLEEAMVGGNVRLSRSEVVLPHYTRQDEEMVIPIERVETDEKTGEIELHAVEGADHIESSLIVTPKDNGTITVHGVPKDGPSANFFLTLERR